MFYTDAADRRERPFVITSDDMQVTVTSGDHQTTITAHGISATFTLGQMNVLYDLAQAPDIVPGVSLLHATVEAATEAADNEQVSA